MFEKLFKIFNKDEKKEDEQIVTMPGDIISEEEKELEEERRQALELKEKIDAIDPEVVAKVREKIKSEFDEIEADPSDLDDYFSELYDIREDLEFELMMKQKKDKVMDALKLRLIFQELEERIKAAGSNIDAYYEWEEKEDELDEEEDLEENKENQHLK